MSLTIRGTRDDGVSAVIGTMLMVTVTVLAGITLYAVMGGFAEEGFRTPANAAFKAQAMDTDGNRKTDRIKITYIGVPTVANGDVVIRIKDAAGTPVAFPAHVGQWKVGDSVIFEPPSAGTYFVTVTILDDTVLDRAVTVDEP